MEVPLRICGLGVHPPLETTLETLQALGRSRVVFCDLKDAKVFAWLKGYCREIKRPKDAKQVVDAARAGSAALAVWGHPQFSSRLVREVERLARAEGLRYEVLGAISPIGSAFARSISFLGGDYGYQGIQAYELETLLKDPAVLTERLPLVVYAEAGSSARWRKLKRLLAGRYPSGHPLRLSEAGSAADRPVTVEELEAAELEGAVLLVPPLHPPGYDPREDAR